MPDESSSSLRYESIERLRTLLNDGYSINRVTHPATSNGEPSTLVDLIKPSEGEYLLTVFGEEAVALSEFIKNFCH